MYVQCMSNGSSYRCMLRVVGHSYVQHLEYLGSGLQWPTTFKLYIHFTHYSDIAQIAELVTTNTTASTTTKLSILKYKQDSSAN